ncbi:peroxidase 65-like [Senna tora]|uniref:Peroxidase n=1 Tax=Senna tora TaxID=362788 RepID=A0A834SZA6_9FABA|nr:peroxidase 65-like [Senna tora]
MMNNMKVNSSNCVRWIGWEPPDHDRVKCNVDGSYFKSTRDAACGGIARDTSGNFLFSFCHRIGCCEIIRAELRGIVDGLEMLWEKGFRKVTIECDSEVALELVSNGVVDTHPCSALVQRVRSLIDRHWDTELVHVFREANQAADFMAKLSHSLAEGFHVFDSPHVGLRSILAADLNSPLVPRLCSFHRIGDGALDMRRMKKRELAGVDIRCSECASGSEIVGDKKKALYVGVGDDVVHDLLDSGDEGDSHKRRVVLVVEATVPSNQLLGSDVRSPSKFDNAYIQNILRGLGLLTSDHALSVDPRTRPIVEIYARNQTAFFVDFAAAMEKVSVLNVKTGRKGEIRDRCDQFNHIPM